MSGKVFHLELCVFFESKNHGAIHNNSILERTFGCASCFVVCMYQHVQDAPDSQAHSTLRQAAAQAESPILYLKIWETTHKSKSRYAAKSLRQLPTFAKCERFLRSLP